MPIPLPNLDDRRWADLVDDGRALLPVYAPQWTNHNVADPGITLMEMFAFVAELDIYRINRIPGRHKRKFLELVGIVPRPPLPARTILTAAVKASQHLPARTEFTLAGKIFSTLYPSDLVPSALMAVQSVLAGVFTDLSAVLRGKTVQLFDAEPPPDSAVYFGFDQMLPNARTSLWIESAGAGAWNPIVCEACDSTAACRSRNPCGSPTYSVSASALRKHHSAQLVWEYLDAAGFWQPIEVKDSTRALTLDGHVWITVPGPMKATPLGRVTNPCFWIRARLAAGQFDAPVLAEGLFFNALECDQSSAAAAAWKLPPLPPIANLQPAGTGDGTPFQQIHLAAPPVVRASVRVFSYENNAWLPWDGREDFDASSPAARHFTLDAPAGVIQFGSGKHGRVPPPGAQLFAAWRVTLAERGTLDANQPGTIPDSFPNITKITNPLAVANGAAAETLAHAISRAVDDREAVHRAVTLADYETLALQTPGTSIARVKAWANTHPILDCFEAVGVITVIVVPNTGAERPVPGAGLLALVHRHLQRRRPVGTRVEVIGPSFLKISVSAQVQALPKQNPARVRQAVIDTLTRFFDPLTGGPEGGGWPFGRDVYRSEVLQAIDAVPGVDHVVSLDLIPENCTPQCGNVCLKPSWLTVSGEHSIEVV